MIIMRVEDVEWFHARNMDRARYGSMMEVVYTDLLPDSSAYPPYDPTYMGITDAGLAYLEFPLVLSTRATPTGIILNIFLSKDTVVPTMIKWSNWYYDPLYIGC